MRHEDRARDHDPNDEHASTVRRRKRAALLGPRSVGPGPLVTKARPGAERLASRLAGTAPGKAWTGIGAGGAAVGVLLALPVLAALARGA